MLDLSLFRKPAFAGVSIVAFALSASMFSMFLYITLYIQDVLGYSPLEAGVIFLPLTLLSFIVAPIAGKLSARIPVRVLLGVGLTLVGVGLLLMHGVELGDDWTTLLPGFLFAGAGIGMVNPGIAADGDRRRAAGEGRHGVGDQQHLPAGGDRDRRRGARRDLPVPGRPPKLAELGPERAAGLRRRRLVRGASGGRAGGARRQPGPSSLPPPIRRSSAASTRSC